LENALRPMTLSMSCATQQKARATQRENLRKHGRIAAPARRGEQSRPCWNRRRANWSEN